MGLILIFGASTQVLRRFEHYGVDFCFDVPQIPNH
jgi:hypothetical protein